MRIINILAYSYTSIEDHPAAQKNNPAINLSCQMPAQGASLFSGSAGMLNLKMFKFR